MRYLLLITLFTGCAVLPDAYKAVGNHKDLKKMCDEDSDGRACYFYGTHLKEKGGSIDERLKYYKKSCNFHNVQGCEAWRGHLSQLSAEEVTAMCESKDYQDCFQGGQAYYEKGDYEKALPLLEKACKLDFESYACELKTKAAVELNVE